MAMAHTKRLLLLENYKNEREELRKGRLERLSWMETTPEFQIVAKLLEQVDISPAIAVQQFLGLTTLSRDSGTIGTHCTRASNSCIILGSRTPPERQSKLVTFIVELKRNTIPDLQTGESILQYDDSLVWTELPTFGWNFSNELHDRCMLLKGYRYNL
jgi:hypothetical protein